MAGAYVLWLRVLRLTSRCTARLTQHRPLIKTQSTFRVCPLTATTGSTCRPQRILREISIQLDTEHTGPHLGIKEDFRTVKPVTHQAMRINLASCVWARGR